jgi:hypothetical protein
METTEQQIGSVKKTEAHPSGLTVMVMGRVGKVYSFKISARFVLGVSLFFLLYVPTSIFMINRYFDLRHVSFFQSERIKDLESDLFRGERSLHRSRQHLALLDDYIQRIEKGQEGGATRVESEALQKKTAGPVLENLSSNKEQAETSTGIVDIKDLVVQKDRSRMNVKFKLVNLQSAENAVGGYVHLIARGKRSDPLQEWTYPQEKLQNGVPEDFSHGQRFLIQKFKPVYGKFNLISGSDQPFAIKVLVYNQAGELILEKEFEVTDAS